MEPALFLQAACRHTLCQALRLRALPWMLTYRASSHWARGGGWVGSLAGPPPQVELLGRLPLLGWWGRGSPRTQDEAGEGPAGLGSPGDIGEAGLVGSSSVQPASPSAFFSPSPSKKFPFIPTHQFWLTDLFFFLRSILLLPWGVNHRHLGLDEGSLSVHNFCCLS